jgi:hypothetical protein
MGDQPVPRPQDSATQTDDSISRTQYLSDRDPFSCSWEIWPRRSMGKLEVKLQALLTFLRGGDVLLLKERLLLLAIRLVGLRNIFRLWSEKSHFMRGTEPRSSNSVLSLHRRLNKTTLPVRYSAKIAFVPFLRSTSIISHIPHPYLSLASSCVITKILCNFGPHACYIHRPSLLFHHRDNICCCSSSCRWGETVSLNFGLWRTYCSSPDDKPIWSWRATAEWYRRKPKNSQKTLTQCHIARNKYHVTWTGREPGPPRREAGD